jgi:hypothetical protein
MLGRVIKKTIPRSTKNNIIIVTSVCIEKSSLKNKTVIIDEPSIKENITKNMVEIIIPAFQTQLFPLNVS